MYICKERKRHELYLGFMVLLKAQKKVVAFTNNNCIIVLRSNYSAI